LSHFKEFDEKVFLVYTSIANTKLHKKIFKLDFGWVVQAGYTHSVNPESESLVKMLCLCEAVIEQADTHLQND
jgi:hypothetical protein